MTQITLYSYSMIRQIMAKKMQITQIMVTRVHWPHTAPHLLLLPPSQLAGRLQATRARNSASDGRWQAAPPGHSCTLHAVAGRGGQTRAVDWGLAPTRAAPHSAAGGGRRPALCSMGNRVLELTDWGWGWDGDCTFHRGIVGPSALH